MCRSIRLLTLVSLLLAAAVSPAANRTAEYWHKQTSESTAALKEGKYERSLKIANRVAADMVEKLGPGDIETQSFGIVLVHKALALAGLGRHDDAVWYWHVALSLYPGLAKLDLAPFGEPGKFLAARTELRDTLSPGEIARLEARTMEPDVTPPKLLRHVMPEFPRGAQAFGVKGKLVVEVLITAEGKITAPLIIERLPAPTLSYVALEAVRRWRFEPGKKNGAPCDVIFNLTVNYKL